MQNNKNYNYIFVFIISVIASLLLSVTSEALKEKSKMNIILDKKKNILLAIGLETKGLGPSEILNLYNTNIEEKHINLMGEEISARSEDIILIENKITGEVKYYLHKIDLNNEVLPLYDSNSQNAFILPISGKGLWSSLYGYIAISKDKNTVQGITFYKQGETAGLGAEIAKEWFQNNFKGKKIFNNYNELVSISVVKGKASDVLSGEQLNHAVDGISGATITSRGVTNLLKRDLNRYKVFLEKI